MKVYAAPLDPATDLKIEVVLVRNPNKVKEFASLIKSGNFEFCAINPEVILHPLQIVVAANIAALKQKNNKMKTKNLNTEILYQISFDKSISNSLEVFGINNTRPEILLCSVVHVEGKGIKELIGLKDEELSPLEELQEIRNTNYIKQSYGVTDIELSVSTLTDSVISRIAVKDCGL